MSRPREIVNQIRGKESRPRETINQIRDKESRPREIFNQIRDKIFRPRETINQIWGLYNVNPDLEDEDGKYVSFSCMIVKKGKHNITVSFNPETYRSNMVVYPR